MSLTAAPDLVTDRLRIRSPKTEDAEAVIGFLMDEVRAAGFGGYTNRGDAWRWFALNVGHWHIHGHGYFMLECRRTGRPAGLCGIWFPEGWPEREIGWVVFDGFEGQGLAFEAAQRVRRWAYESLGLTTLTSNILPSNTRSKALARRLGAVYERTYTNITMGEDELWRHPGPEGVR